MHGNSQWFMICFQRPIMSSTILLGIVFITSNGFKMQLDPTTMSSCVGGCALPESSRFALPTGLWHWPAPYRKAGSQIDLFYAQHTQKLLLEILMWYTKATSPRMRSWMKVSSVPRISIKWLEDNTAYRRIDLRASDGERNDVSWGNPGWGGSVTPATRYWTRDIWLRFCLDC